MLETIKYAGQLATGFKENLIELSWKEREKGILIATYGDVEYDGHYRHGKQNACTITATSGAAIEIDTKGRTRLLGLAESFLTEAKEVSGQTFDVKAEIKKFGFSWNGESKSWKK